MNQTTLISHSSKQRGYLIHEITIASVLVFILTLVTWPNYQEAKTHSKISRTYNDMARMAVAIESYRIDHTGYPFVAGQPRLTSPLAYLTTIPKSPFVEVPPQILDGSSPPFRWEQKPENRMTYSFTSETRDENGSINFDPNFNMATINCFFGSPTSGYSCVDRDYFAYGTTSPSNIPAAFLVRPYRQTASWSLISYGPDGDNEVTNNSMAVYDPTNGTFSNGDIVYIGPSVGFLHVAGAIPGSPN